MGSHSLLQTPCQKKYQNRYKNLYMSKKMITFAANSFKNKRKKWKKMREENRRLYTVVR